MGETPEFMSRWGSVIAAVEIFAGLENELITRLIGGSELVTVAAGEAIIREGEIGDNLYLIVEGEAEVFMARSGHRSIKTLGPSDVFGEISLLIGGHRSATVIATGPLRALSLSRERATAVLQADPEAMRPLLDRASRVLSERMRMLRLAAHAPALFGELRPELLEQMQGQMRWVRLRSGETLFRSGEVADAAYAILLGRLEFELDGSTRGLVPGEWVGELALLSDDVRTGTVYATRDTELACLPRSVFYEFVVQQPEAMLALSRRLGERLRTSLSERRQGPSTSIVVVPASSTVDLRAFMADLHQALRAQGSVARLDAAGIDAKFGLSGIASVRDEHPGRLRLVPYLLQQEETHDYVLYDGGVRWTGWTERAVRQADHVLVVADGSDPPGLGTNELELERMIRGSHAPQRSLVLLHPSTQTRIRGTRTWLELRSVDAHYHVRRGHSADVERLARVLTGRAISLVVGGGGARSCAGLGVIQAMRELGIPIDAVAGTSMGAVLGAAFAAGYSIEQMLDEYSTYTAAILDVTLPAVSLLSGERLARSHTKLLGEFDIEDLALPFFCVSTNLTRSKVHIHSRGSAATAVRASMAIPGVFPPAELDGDMLVDGGLFNNLPVDLMDQRIGGSIVAVDVIPEIDARVQGALPPVVSGWRVLARRVNPFDQQTPEIPTILNLLMRSVAMGSVSLTHSDRIAELAAVFLRPRVRQWNVFDFRAARSIATQGYEGSIEALQQWWQGPR